MVEYISCPLRRPRGIVRVPKKLFQKVLEKVLTKAERCDIIIGSPEKGTRGESISVKRLVLEN